MRPRRYAGWQIQLPSSSTILLGMGIVAILAAVGSSLVFQAGGFLEARESHFFLQNYLADRSLLEKIFDVELNDLGSYQARELSYLFDFIDAQFIFASIRAGIPHFYPLSHYLSLILIAGLQVRCCRRYLPELPDIHSFALTLLFLTSPAAYFATFFRSSKILVSLALISLLWGAFFALPRRPAGDIESTTQPVLRRVFREFRRRDLLAIYSLALAMTLVDRQGFIFCGMLAGLCAVTFSLSFDLKALVCAVLFGAAFATNAVYNLVVGPYLIRVTNGYDPSFEFQNLQFLFDRFSGSSASSYIPPDAESLALLPEFVAYFFGNAGFIAGLAVLAFFAFALGAAPGPSRRGEPKRQVLLSIFALSLVALCALNWVLALRAPYLLFSENMLVYYALPTMVLVLFTSAFCIERFLRRFPNARTGSGFVLFLCLVGNIAALPSHYGNYLYPGNSWSGYAHAAELRVCLRSSDGRGASLPHREAEICRFLIRRIGGEPARGPGDAALAYDEGVRHHIGDGVPRNEAQALMWFRKAARGGYLTAQLDLAHRYRDGFRIVANPNRSMKWFRAAALQGDAGAQFALSEGHRTGNGVERSESQALYWVERAAASGDLDARLTLGTRYAKGDGVPVDYVLAHFWMTQSLTNFRPNTKEMITRLEKIMSPEQIADAKRRER